MKLIVIGIGDRMHHGKTTFAKALYEYIVYKSTLVALVNISSFADPLKEECAQITGLPIEWFYSKEKKEILRPLMVWWATEFRRNEALGGYEHYWRDKARNRINDLYKEAQIECSKIKGDFHEPKALFVIFDDVRFKNEAELIREYGDAGIMVHIEGINMPPTPQSNHISEAGLPAETYDCHITNDHALGTEILPLKAEEFYERYLAPLVA